MLWLCDIRLPAVGSGVRKARGLVEALDLPLPRETRDDLRLLISEVVTNAIRHGSPDGQAARPPIRVRFGLDGPRLRVEIIDRGPGFEPTPRGPMSQLDSGWGVHFVDQLADRWGTRRMDEDWVVWFEVRLPPHPGAGAAMTYGQRAEDHAPMPADQRRAHHASNLARTG